MEKHAQLDENKSNTARGTTERPSMAPFNTALPTCMRMNRTETPTRKIFTSKFLTRCRTVSSIQCSSRNRTLVFNASFWQPKIQSSGLLASGRDEDHHFPDRSFTLQHPRCYSLLSACSCWLHSFILSATFLTTSFFAFVASPSLALSWACSFWVRLVRSS